MEGMVGTWAQAAASGIELVGVVLIVGYALYGLGLLLVGMARRVDGDRLFHRVRHRLARGILLGLEFLIAGDIIHTVAVELNFETVGVLALVVLIRTFLSFTLEVEMDGRWPWQGEGKGEGKGKGEE